MNYCHCNEYPRECSIIVLDNVSVHVDPEIVSAIKAKGCLVKYLPPYSPDYNPVELTFSMLKAWMGRHFMTFQHVFQDDFGGFLKHAVEHSGCDRKAIAKDFLVFNDISDSLPDLTRFLELH